MTPGRLPLYLVVALALAAALGQARAAPLDSDTCARLQSEQETLETAGIQRDMAKGAAWAKANLAPEKLAQVRRFIELEEQIVFRCRRKSLVNLPPDPPEPAVAGESEAEKQGKDDAEAKSDSKAAPKAAAPKAAPAEKAKAPAPAAKPAPKKAEAGKAAADKAPGQKAVPAKAQPAEKPASQAKKQSTEIAKKPPAPMAARPPGADTAGAKGPAKAKVDDAYKAPPPDPEVNPFAGQINLPLQ